MSARTAGKPGFTLIELLCSMAVGSLILLAAAFLLRSSGDGYERIGGSVATEREARALISQLTADLATAHFHPDSVIENTGTAWPMARLGFLSLQPAQAQSPEKRVGDLCAVHYYLKDLQIGGKTVRCLMRGFRDSSETFEALEKEDLRSLFQPDDDLDEPVAFGVAGFSAQPVTRDESGRWRAWASGSTKDPEAFDVRLVIARRDLAGRLRTAADWDGAGAAGKQLGNFADAHRNRNLESYGAKIRFGNHEKF
jgi:prepilin-type N-terminal cleavage/methylation domain-containing protein